SEFRPRCQRSLQYDVGRHAGLVSSLDYFLEPLAQGRTNLAILVELRVGLQEVGVELRLRVRRLDDRDPDAPRAQLMVERLRIAFDRVLGRRIERHVRHWQKT